MSRKRLTRWMVLFSMLLGAVTAVFLLQTETADAGIYNAGSEQVYAEYWVPHANNFSGLCDNSGLSSNAFIQSFIEPRQGECEKSLAFTMPGLTGANSVEIYVDLWRNRDTPSAAFSINGNNFRQTNVGSDWSRIPYLSTIPNSEFLSGANTITFKDTAGAYHVKDVAFRVFGPATANTPDGALTGIAADNGWHDPMAALTNTLEVNSDQLVLTATITTENADYVEFHAYYDGYDEDNDGDYTDWHNKGRQNWFPGGMDEMPTGGVVDHIGTVPVTGSGDYAITWDLPHIINQSGVRFKIRLVNQDGDVNYVRDAAGGASEPFELARNRPVAYFIKPDFEDFILYNDGNSPEEVTIDFQLPPDISEFDSAYLIGAYWRNPTISINNNGAYNAFDSVVPFADGEWYLSVVELDFSDLQGGMNSIKYGHRNGYGEFIEKPGPMIVLRRSTPLAGGDNTDPHVYNQLPANGDQYVPADTNISFNIFDAGGIDFARSSLQVNGSPVTPQISGNEFNAFITYNPPADFDLGSTVAVQVNACDVSNNCIETSYSFEIEPEILPSSVTSDDFNACTLDTGVWSFVHPAGDGSYEITGEQLILNVPGGSVHDLSKTNQNAPRLMQAANDQPFDMQVKFDTTVSQPVQSQGVLVWQNSQNYLRFEILYGAGGTISANIFRLSNGNFSQITTIPMPEAASDDPLYIRIRRDTLTSWEASFARENRAWKSYSFTQSLEMSQVGFYGINWASTPSQAPAMTVAVDYFFNQANPIDPEDEDPLILPVSVIGLGEVTKVPVCGNPVDLTAVETTPGWSFDHWESSISSLNGVTETVRTGINFVHQDTATAVFTQDEYEVTITEVSVDHEGSSTVSTAGGTVTQSAGPYLYGDEVTVTAVPAPGWTFSGWQGAGLDGDDTLTQMFTITQDEAITATFTEDKYTIATSTTGGGNIIVEAPTERGYLLYGEEVTVRAVPDSGWLFTGWGGDLNGINPVVTLTVTGDLNITASFNDYYYLYLPAIVRP